VEFTGVACTGATGLYFQKGRLRSEEEMIENSVGHISRAKDIPHGAAMADSKGSSSAQLAKALEATNHHGRGTGRKRRERRSSPSEEHGVKATRRCRPTRWRTGCSGGSSLRL
jgi:hypothetical protein